VTDHPVLPGARHRDDGPLTLGEGLEALARLVPPGRAVSYGGLAGLLGVGGPRQAGRAMAESSPGTPWWRVVRADGSLPPELAARAAVEHEREATPRTPAGRVDLPRARWEPDDGAARAIRAIADRIVSGPGARMRP